jgi:molybdenum cofactor cytidylyltransferase
MIGGVVLAAGAGRRFGGSKLTAELDGRPLLNHAIEAMLAVPAIERVAVVLGAQADDVVARADLAGVETVACGGWEEGIAASLRAGVEHLADAEAVVITLGDQPFITPQVIAAIVEHIDARPLAARATYAGRPGHPVLIKRALFDDVRSLRGDAGARDLLVGAGLKELECGHLCRADDIDTRDDLEGARRRVVEAG